MAPHSSLCSTRGGVHDLLPAVIGGAPMGVHCTSGEHCYFPAASEVSRCAVSAVVTTPSNSIAERERVLSVGQNKYNRSWYNTMSRDQAAFQSKPAARFSRKKAPISFIRPPKFGCTFTSSRIQPGKS